MRRILLGWMLVIAGCAPATLPAPAPDRGLALECDDVQKKVLAFDGQDRSQLFRSFVTMATALNADSAAKLESCLSTNLRIECGTRSCLIREKYFVTK